MLDSLFTHAYQYMVILAGNPDAVNDIINNPMFAGSLESLSKVIQICDSIFAFIVSFAGFFIISSAMLKNVIAGMYCSNKKFFDKVNEVKNNFVVGIDGKVQHLPGAVRGVGTVGVILLRMMPDPKEISEFQDDAIEPRDYFIKAIPQMIGTCMIGVCIYNGYYKQLLGKTATLGSYIVEKFILDVDPVEGLNKILGWTSSPNMASSEDTSESGKLTYSIGKEMYHNVVSFYTDQTELNAKNSISTSIESWVSGQVSANSTPYLDTSKWEYSIKVMKVLNQPNLAVVEKVGDEQVIQSWAMQIASLNLDTKYHKNEDWWLQVIVVWDRVRDKSVTSTGVVTDGTLLVPNGQMTLTTIGGVEYTLIKMSSSQLNYFTANGTKVNNTYALSKDANSGGILIKGDVRNIIKSGGSVSGFTYTCGGNSAYVTSIKLDTNVSVYQIESSKGTVDLGKSFTLETSSKDAA